MKKKTNLVQLVLFLYFTCFLFFGITVKANTEQLEIKVTANITKQTTEPVKLTLSIPNDSNIVSVRWAKSNRKLAFFESKGKGKDLTLNQDNKVTVTIQKNGTYTFYVMDDTGNSNLKKYVVSNIKKQATETTPAPSTTPTLAPTTKPVNPTIPTTNNSEMRAMWISYLEFGKKAYTETQFQSFIDTMFDNCVALNMNTVIVQIRPFSDALYPSNYFPWSAYVSGQQGRNPGYDPLKYMISAAHTRGLEFHAWLNPYRVTLSTTDKSTLAANHPARNWMESSSAAKQRNVLSFNNNLYYNPASLEVHDLIVNGIKEIVENYDVDGIHLDDYFYPNLGSKYASTFDNKEYNTYYQTCIDEKTIPKGIADWRRSNVNTLIKKIYSIIKGINPDVSFGISPAGNIENLYLESGNYVDVKTWMQSSFYIDYICPQIYWSFTNKVCPYKETLNRWNSYKTSNTVDMYVGIAAYRAGSNEETEWATSNDVLKRMIVSARDTGKVDGFFFFRYEHFFLPRTQAEIKNLMSVLK